MPTNKIIRSFFSLLLCLVIVPSVIVTAQENDTTIEKHSGRRYRHWERFVSFHGRPTIDLSAGFSSLNLKNMALPFASPGLAEVRIGHTKIDDAEFGTAILKYDFDYLSIGTLSTDFRGKSSGNEINSELWRFGAGWKKGYGYRLGDEGAILLYHVSGLNWSRLNVRDQTIGNLPGGTPDIPARRIIAPADSLLLAPFDGTFRFGTMTGGGIAIQPMPILTINGGYERQVIFPAHLFWKWLGSTLLEVAGQEAIDHFVAQILDSTPSAAPIVGFVLKNGFSYAFYELRKDKMNYPFDSEPPLRSDAVTFGLVFSF